MTIKSTERIVLYHVNAGSGEPQWRAEIRGGECDKLFMGYEGPEALGQALEWAGKE